MSVLAKVDMPTIEVQSEPEMLTSIEGLSTIADSSLKSDFPDTREVSDGDDEETRSLSEWWAEEEEERGPIRRLTDIDWSGVTKWSSLQFDCPQTQVRSMPVVIDLAMVGEAELKIFTSICSVQVRSMADSGSEIDFPCTSNISDDEQDETLSLSDWWVQSGDKFTPIRRLTELDQSGVSGAFSHQRGSVQVLSMAECGSESDLLCNCKVAHGEQDRAWSASDGWVQRGDKCSPIRKLTRFDGLGVARMLSLRCDSEGSQTTASKAPTPSAPAGKAARRVMHEAVSKATGRPKKVSILAMLVRRLCDPAGVS